MSSDAAATNHGATWEQPDISFWHHQAPAAIVPDPIGAGACDVAVIGAGLLGSCTAYWLARQGVRVCVLEQKAPAFGATGRNGGFLVVGTAEGYAGAIARVGHRAARSVHQITYDSRALMRQVIAEEGIACEYREPGRLNLSLGGDEHRQQAQSLAALHSDGFDGELLDRAQVQELINSPLGDEIVGGVFNREDGLLQPARFVQGVLAAARRHGARVAQAAVQSFVEQNGSVELYTTAGVVRAARVVVAVNAWTNQLIPALGDLIRPVRGQVLAYAPLATIFTTGTGAAVTPTGEYWHQTPDGSIVLGGCRAAAPDGEVGLLQEGTTPSVQTALEQVFPRLFPKLRGLQVQRRWSGPMAFTADYMPICDRAPGHNHVWFVGGFCGHGMPFGMRLGQLLAEAACRGETPAELDALRLARPTLGPAQPTPA